MKVLFLTGRLVYNAYIIEEYRRRRPSDQIMVVVSDFFIQGKSALESLSWLARQTGVRHLGYKMYEIVGTHLVALCSGWLRRESQWPSLKRICDSQQIPLYFSKDMNDPNLIARIRSFGPDIIVTKVMQRLKSEMIAIPKLGIINVHPGDLPAYRGLASYIWPLVHGHRESGCSLHWIQDERLDTGDIIVKGTYAIDPQDTAQTLNLKNTIIGAQLLPQVVEKLEQKTLFASPQKEGRYYSWPSRRDIKRVHEKGRRLIRARDLLRMWSSKEALERFSYTTHWSRACHDL